MKFNFKNKYFFLFLKILITFSLVYYIVEYVSTKKILSNLQSINLYYFILALLLVPVNIFFQYRKWNLISRQLLNIQDKTLSLNSLFHGFAAGLITPFRAGEYLARNLAYKENSLKVAFATFIDKLFNMLIILFIGALSLVFLLIKTVDINLYIKVVLIFLLLLVMSAILNTDILFKIFSKIKFSFFTQIVDLFREYKNFPKSFIMSIVLFSFVHYLLTLLQYSLILFSLNSFDTFFNLILFSSLLLFGKTIIPPFTIGELGIREASSIFFAKYFLITKEMAFNSTILVFIINLLLPAILGLIFILKEK